MIRELFLEDLSLWNCVWQSTLLAMVGLAVSFLLRHRPARAFQVLFLAMTAALLVPVMSVIVKHYELGMFTAEPIALNSEMKDLSSAIPYGTSTVSSGADTQIQTREGATDIVIAKSGKENINIPWHMILLFGWLIATLVLLGRLLIAFFNGVCLLKRSKIQACEHIEQAADIARARLGISKCLLIRSNQEIRSPMIWCWCKNPVLLVPSKLDNNTDWVGVICHELAHWRRLDHISGLIAEIIVCILSWNPLLWWSKKRMVRLGEQACDDWVVAGGRPVESYARSLLDFKPQKQAAFVPAVVHSRKEVATRIRRILKDGCVNPRTGATWALVVSLVTACLATSVAFAQTRPAKPETAIEQKQKPSKSLHDAAADGDIEQVKSLILKGADVNEKNHRGHAPLYYAVEQGHRKVAELLIAKGADVDAESHGVTALHGAARGNHKDTAELLIQEGAEIDSKDNYSNTPLYYAAWRDHRDVAEILLASGADVNAKDKWDLSPLHYVAKHGLRDMAELLILNGADVNAKTKSGATPLQKAVLEGQKDIAKLLVAKGADVSDFHFAACVGDLARVKRFIDQGTDVDTKVEFDQTPLYWAACTGQQDVAEFLVAKGADVNAKTDTDLTALHQAAKIGATKLAELLISNGADVNANSEDADTPMHLAAEKGHREVVNLLFAKGADINSKNQDGRTPLDVATMLGDKDMAALLIDKSADINTKDKEGLTALHWAILQDHRDVAAFLIDKGADINVTDKRGQTPLHQACSRGRRDMAEFLISKGADINVKNQQGMTPLHQACSRGNKDIVEFLIAKGADIEAKNKWGGTPLHQAARFGHKNVAEILIAAGADVNARNQAGQTPINIAGEKGHSEITKLLRKHGATGMGNTPLHYAAARGDIEQVKLLISEDADINAMNNNGQVPLHLAAFNNNPEIVGILIANGADIEAEDKGGNTALRGAAVRGHKEAVELLLDKGADINNKGPLALTSGYGTTIHYDVIQLLIERGADIEWRGSSDCTPLQVVAEVGRKEVAELLVAHGAKVDAAPSKFFGTTYHQATRGGHPEMVRWCLSKGMDIPPLHQAAYFGEADKVRSLLNKGADVNQEDIAGFTALHCAVFGRKKEIVQLLIDRGGDVNANNACNAPLLFWACGLAGDLDIVKLLVENGAEVNSRGFEGMRWGSILLGNYSNLHRAAHLGHAHIVEYLLDKGANINATCTRGEAGLTPLHFAARSGRANVVRTLLANGADASLRSKEGHTALDLAKQENRTNVIDVLRKHGSKVTGAAESLRRAVASGETEKAKALLPPLEGLKAKKDKLAGRRFAFLYTEGFGEHQNGVLLFKEDGTIGEYSHPNESTWETDEEGRVLIKHKDGRISTVFNKIAIQDDKYKLSGPFLLREGIDHILREQ